MEQPSKRMKLEPSMDERSSKISSLVGERCKRSSSLQLQPEQSSIPKSFESLPVELIYAICHYLSCMEKMVLKRVSRRCYFVLRRPSVLGNRVNRSSRIQEYQVRQSSFEIVTILCSYYVCSWLPPTKCKRYLVFS